MTKPPKRHFIKWHPEWWREDKNLQSCSLTARGLWIELLMLMHDCEPYGHLMVGGASPDAAAISRLVGSTPTEVKRALAELESREVSSRTASGVLFSRRMVKDEATYRSAVENGKRGGNPKLKDPDDDDEGLAGGITPGDNPMPKGPANPQALAGARERARSSELQKGNSSSSSHLNEPNTSRNARARGAAEPKNQAASSKPVNEHDAFWAWWCDRYAQLTEVPDMPKGAAYPDNAHEHSKANEVLRLARQSGAGLDVAKAQAERFFAHPTFGKEAPTLGRLIANWATLFETRSGPTVVSPKAHDAVRKREADERAVHRAWCKKHQTELEVPGLGGGTMRVPGLDTQYPGYEAAKAELEADARTTRERKPA